MLISQPGSDFKIVQYSLELVIVAWPFQSFIKTKLGKYVSTDWISRISRFLNLLCTTNESKIECQLSKKLIILVNSSNILQYEFHCWASVFRIFFYIISTSITFLKWCITLISPVMLAANGWVSAFGKLQQIFGACFLTHRCRRDQWCQFLGASFIEMPVE